MHPDSWKRLEDARVACGRIRTFINGKSKDEFEGSELLQSAVERQIEIVGESLVRAAKDDTDFEKFIPDLRKIVGLRNRLIHGHNALDIDPT